MAGQADCRQKAKKFCAAKLADLFNADNQAASRLGFTLAEVLITLGIIGVVAALTMPSLIAQHKNQETVARLQKAISVLNNGMRRMMVDEGVDNITDLEVYQCENIKCYSPYFKKYFNVVMDNADVTSNQERKDFYPYDQVKYLKGNVSSLAGAAIVTNYDFVTADGILYVPICPWYGFGAVIDVNGKRGPNQFGRDIFLLNINGGTYVPKGGDTWDDASNNDYCNPESGLGQGCAARIVQDGWKIKY